MIFKIKKLLNHFSKFKNYFFNKTYGPFSQNRLSNVM